MDASPYNLLLLLGLVCAGGLLLAGLAWLILRLAAQRLLARFRGEPAPRDEAGGKPVIAALRHERRVMELNIDAFAVEEEVEMFSVLWEAAPVESLDLNDHDEQVYFIPQERLAGPGPQRFDSAHVSQLRGFALSPDAATGWTEVILEFADGQVFSFGLTPRGGEAERWAAQANRLLEELQAGGAQSS